MQSKSPNQKENTTTIEPQSQRWYLFNDIICGIISWTLINQFPFVIFFYPMVEMSWTGWEAFAVTFLSPTLAGIGPLRRFAAKNYFLFRFFSLIGILSFYVPDISTKIAMVGTGVFFDLLGTFSLWVESNNERRTRSIHGFLLGLICCLCFRLAFRSFPVIWIVQQANIAICVLGILASCSYYFEPQFPSPTKNAVSVSSVRCGLGLAGSLFMLDCFFSAPGTIPRWIELPPFPYGVLIILSLCAGIMSIFYAKPAFFNSPLWGTFGLVGSALFILPYPLPYIKLIGAIMLAMYSVTVWNGLFQSFAHIKSNFSFGFAFFIGMLGFIGLIIWELYCVAYKFVPYGELFRERSQSMTFVATLFMLIGHLDWSNHFSVDHSKTNKNSIRSATIAIVLLLLSPAVMYRTLRIVDYDQSAMENHMNEIRPLVWAVHFGFDNFGDTNVPALASKIKEAGANVIGLVETDTMRIVMDNRDLVEWIADELDFYSDFGPSSATNTWGCALITAFPIVHSDRIILPSPEGELACLIDADLLVNNTVVRIIVSHFGNTEDKLDLELQTQALEKLVRSRPQQPTIFTGYLTTEPFSPRYERIVQSGLKDTVNSLDRYCLYILYNNLQLQWFDRIDKGNVSDTEAQIAGFTLKPIAHSEHHLMIEEHHPPEKIDMNSQCNQFFNDTVKCQASESCGWCQLKDSGLCVSPSYFSHCKAFYGTWVGPTDATDSQLTYEKLQQFIQGQFQQQKNGLDSVSVLDETTNRYLWKIDRFQEIDSFKYYYTSPVVPINDKFWRFKIHLPRKSAAPTSRRLGVFLETVPTSNGFRTQTATATFKVLHPRDAYKSIRFDTGIHTFSDKEYGGYPATFGQLYQEDFINQGSLSLEIQITFQ